MDRDAFLVVCDSINAVELGYSVNDVGFFWKFLTAYKLLFNGANLFFGSGFIEFLKLVPFVYHTPFIRKLKMLIIIKSIEGSEAHGSQRLFVLYELKKVHC